METALKIAIVCLLIGLSYFVAPLGVDAYRNYQGICSDTGKRLSEREIVEIASQYVNATDDELLTVIQENQILGWKQVSAPDSELTDFEVISCCTIAPWDTLRAEEQEIVTPVRKMLGRFRAWVNLIYEMPDGTYRARLLPIGTCGEFPSDAHPWVTPSPYSW